jgi:uncharacterized membrane protein YadS
VRYDTGMSETKASGLAALYRTEDCWAIWLGFLIIAASLGAFLLGGSIQEVAVTPGAWTRLGDIAADLRQHGVGYLLLLGSFGLVFSLSARVMGHPLRRFVPGFVLLFLLALLMFYLEGSELMRRLDLGAPLLALLFGLVLGNLRAPPEWLKTSLRTEYYVKTGIVLLGATLPLTLIASAGPLAFLQATVVSVTTWATIYLCATRLFHLDPRFGAVLGTGGAVCGVSGSIAVGGAVRADKDHIAIGIAVVSVWAIVMILVLTALTKWLVPGSMSPGVAGAWVGTSEYADAAGFAVVAELAQQHGDAPIHAFTLMKVIGRDIWIGIWAFVLSIISVVYWEKNTGAGRAGAAVIWQRFPKFVLGFFAASLVVSAASATAPADHVGVAPFAGVFKSSTGKQRYSARFDGYVAPPALRDRFSVDLARAKLRFRGKMSLQELGALGQAASTADQRLALKELHKRSDWFGGVLEPAAIAPIKKLRSWCFVLCFLCIGLSTRFRELFTFGMKPFWAFTLGVLVNVPLGYLLSAVLFKRYWSGLG